MRIIKVISTELDTQKRRITKFLRMGKSDIQTAYNSTQYGIDTNPVKDMQAIHTPTGESGESVVIGYINTNLLAEVGSIRLFSENTYLHLRENGQIEIGGTGDYAVRFNELKKGFDQLKADFNSHIHTTTATVGASAAPGVITPPTASSSANIDNSKIEYIEVK